MCWECSGLTEIFHFLQDERINVLESHKGFYISIFLLNKCIFKCSCKMCLLFLYGADNVGNGKNMFSWNFCLELFLSPSARLRIKLRITTVKVEKEEATLVEVLFQCLLAKWHKCALGDSMKSQKVFVKEQDHGTCTQTCVLYHNFCCRFTLFCRETKDEHLILSLNIHNHLQLILNSFY